MRLDDTVSFGDVTSTSSVSDYIRYSNKFTTFKITGCSVFGCYTKISCLRNFQMMTLFTKCQRDVTFLPKVLVARLRFWKRVAG
jgi:hypothetical protein